MKPQIPRISAHKLYWHQVWLQARENTPQRRAQCPYTCWGTTCLLVGWPLYSGQKYSGHSRVYAATCRGNRPRDAEVRRKLLLLAGPLGKHLAWLKLQRLGIAHRYIKPSG